MCESLAIPKTAKNLKPLEAPKVAAPIKPTADPFDSYEKAAKAVSKMMKQEPPPVASSSKGKGRLVTRIRTPPFYPSPDLEHFENYEQSGFDWAADRQRNFAEEYREYSREPSVSLGEESIRDEEYNFDESDDSEGATRQLGYIDRRMDVDDDIADAAGLERQVPLLRNKLLLITSQCTTQSTSTQETKELLSSEVDRSVMQTLVNSLNTIELHTQNCEKCKQLAYSQKAWILDSGASQHFTNTKEDFIDFEIVKNAPKVKTASHTVLQVEGQGTILLSHLVNIRGAQVVKTTRIYPVMYIPRLSAKLLSMGSFLQDRQEVHGNLKQITFHDAITRKPLLSAYPRSSWDTIFWVLPQEIKEASIATIYKVDYKIWHKHLGHPSKDVLKRAKEL